jgi:hypothetical protein
VQSAVLIILTVLAATSVGCAHRSELQFTKGKGDAGQFIIQEAIARGGRAVTTNGLPALTGTWTYSKDPYGVMIRLPPEDCGTVEVLLMLAFGKPGFGPIGNQADARIGGYRLTPQGGALQFTCDANGTQVIVLRPMTESELWDNFYRATRTR